MYPQKNIFQFAAAGAFVHSVMRSFIILLCLISSLMGRAGAQQATPVFRSGSEGHKSYRIPAIVTSPNGDLLAFAEGRVHDAGDFGDINLVMKRSRDGGKSWSALETIVDADTLQAGNPAPVVDLTDPAFPGGRIFLFYNTGNNHEGEVRKGNGLREVWYITSTNNGRSWSKPENITLQVHRPYQPAINRAYHFAEDWRSYANTPGHALQFKNGAFAGRIFVAANHSAGDPKRDFTDYSAHAYYTDDHGKTFHLSADVPVPGSNESMAAELPGGRLMMNIRNQRGDIRARIVAISSDGGASWDSAGFDLRLPDPVCQGSLLTLRQRNGHERLAFCNAADTVRRNHLTLRISEDAGRHWTKTIRVDESTKPASDYTAYSDLVQIGDNTVGVLYERDDYKEIVFKRITIR